MWRYAIILDRRIRAISWGRNDFTASNAIFWTSGGWNGEEYMVSASASHCLQYPELTHGQIMSITTLKTLITTLQGVSILSWLIGALSYPTNIDFSENWGLDMVFFPLAILGLLRILAAPWLTEDFVYAASNDVRNGILPPSLPYRIVQNQKAKISDSQDDFDPLSIINDHNIQLSNSRDGMDPFLQVPFQPVSQFKAPKSFWPSYIFRVFFLLLICCIWGLSLVYIIPISNRNWYSPTGFLIRLLYFILLTIAVFIHTFYLLYRQATSTLLPCISQTWYKVYTLFLTGFMSMLIIVASIETNKNPNGQYTSVVWQDKLGCSNQFEKWWVLSPESRFFSFATQAEVAWQNLSGANFSSIPVATLTGNEVSEIERFWLYNFTGYCVGTLLG